MRECNRRGRGFTLIELVVVIAIMGVLFSVVLPSLDGVSPKYRLRAAAREVGSEIHQVRSLAAGTGRTYALHYDLDDNKMWIILPPVEGEDPDQPLDERERLTTLDLPDQVTIEEVVLAGGSRVSRGEVDIVIDSLGNEGSHIVYLRNTEDSLIAVKFNALLGFVDYFRDEVDFERYP